MSASPSDSQILCSVKNTFLHFEDGEEKDNHRSLPRSNSWTPSSSAKSSASSSYDARHDLDGLAAAVSTVRPKVNRAQSPGPMHEVFDESSSQSEQSHSSELPIAVPAVPAAAAVPKPAVPAAEPPIGNALHESGQCRPCRFVASVGGCNNGRDCVFCHHPDHSPYETTCHRPSKGVRNSSKKAVANIRNSRMSQEEKLVAYKQLAAKGPYMRHLLKEIVPELDVSDVVGAPLDIHPEAKSLGERSSTPEQQMPFKMSL